MSVWKRRFITDVGEIAGKILLQNNKPDPRLSTHSFPKSKHETDLAFSDVIKKLPKYDKDPNLIVLSIPKILKKLQFLRRTNEDKSFFTLLEKISSSDATWFNKFNDTVKLPSNSNIASAFYNELIFMLYKKSLSLSINKNPEEVIIMGKFAIHLLKSYQVPKPKQIDIKSLHRLLQLVVKTRSVGYVYGALALLKSPCLNLPKQSISFLNDITLLEFFCETKQHLKLISKLNELFRVNIHEKPSKKQITLYFPVLIKIIKNLIMNGYTAPAIMVVTYLNSCDEKIFTEHEIISLLELSEKFENKGLTLILRNLQGVVPKENTEFYLGKSNMPFSDYMVEISKVMDNPFSIYGTKYYDSLMCMLSSKKLKYSEAESLLRKATQVFISNKQLRLMTIDILLSYISHDIGYLGYLQFVRLMIHDLGLVSELMDATNTCKSSYPGLHSIFNTINSSDIEIVTTLTMFDRFIVSRHMDIHLDDYIYLLRKKNLDLLPPTIKERFICYIFYNILRKSWQEFWKDGRINFPITLKELAMETLSVEKYDEIVCDIEKLLTITPIDTLPSHLDKRFYEIFQTRFGDFETNDIKLLMKNLSVENLPSDHYLLAKDIQNSDTVNILFDDIERRMANFEDENKK